MQFKVFLHCWYFLQDLKHASLLVLANKQDLCQDGVEPRGFLLTPHRTFKVAALRERLR